jgi:alkylhydroperoxidase family enzyme
MVGLYLKQQVAAALSFIVELTLVTCEANLTNRLNNALDAEPDLGD